MDVPNPLQKHINEANSWRILHIPQCQRQLNIVHGKCVQKDKQVCKRLVVRQEHDSLVHVHQFLDHIDARLFDEKTGS